MANEVVTEFKATDAGLDEELANAEKAVLDFKEVANDAFASIGKAAAIVFASKIVADFFSDCITEAKAAEETWARWNAVVKAGGDEIKITNEQLQNLADNIQTTTRYQGSAVVQAATLLNQYENLNKDGIEQAINLGADMAALFGGDLQSSVMKVGKALNDPIHGLKILKEVGIVLDESQKELIKTLQESGDVAGAAAILYEELNSKVGGVAEAMGDTTSGRIEKLTNQISDLKQTIGEGLLLQLEKTIPVLEAFAAGFKKGMGVDASENIRQLNAELSTTEKLMLSIGEHVPNLYANFTGGTATITEGSMAWILKGIRGWTGDIAGLTDSIETLEGTMAERRAARAGAMPVNRAVTAETIQQRQMEKWADERMGVHGKAAAEEANKEKQEYIKRWADEELRVWEEEEAKKEEAQKEATKKRAHDIAVWAEGENIKWQEKEEREANKKGRGGRGREDEFAASFEGLTDTNRRITAATASGPMKEVEKAIIDGANKTVKAVEEGNKELEEMKTQLDITTKILAQMKGNSGVGP